MKNTENSAVAPQQNAPSKGLAVASLVLGIIAVILGLMAIGGLLGLLAIIFGIIAVTKKAGKGMAVAGIVTGSVGVVFSVIAVVFVFGALPALQTSQRDTMRRNDAAFLASEISAYEVNNRGKLPTDSELTSGSFAAQYLTAGGESWDYSIAVAGSSATNTMVFDRAKDCNGTTGAHHYSIRVGLENGEEYCTGA